MRRLLQLAAFLLLAQPAWGAITFQREAHNVCTYPCTTVTTTVTVNSGDTVVVNVADVVANVSSVTDTGGSTYTSKTVFGTDGSIEQWVVLSANSSTSVTVTMAASAVFEVSIVIYTGVNSFGHTATAASAGSTNPLVSLTTQDANNYVVTGVQHRSGPGTCTIQNGTFRLNCFNTAQGSVWISTLDNTGASAGSVTTSYTSVNSIEWFAAALELRSGGGAAARPPTQMMMGCCD